jgi:SAM-dependent methyltransferase
VDVRRFNQQAWDDRVRNRHRWTRPIGDDIITLAKRGTWELFVTPTRPIPKAWLPEVDSLSILCLASGGGQQAPLLAAAGAKVVVLDNSPLQLEQDRHVAEAHGLDLQIVEGDMADLSQFASESFDRIVHPISNCFVPNVHPVWREAYRLLRNGGSLISGFCNPVRFIFDEELEKRGELRVKHSLPHSDASCLSDDEIGQMRLAGRPMEFGHTLDDQIGGQLAAGFVLAGFFEDSYDDKVDDPLSRFMASFIATHAIKQRRTVEDA